MISSGVTPAAWEKYFSLSEEGQEDFACETLRMAEIALDELVS